MKSTVLLLGGSGFIGTNLTDALVGDHEVITFDRHAPANRHARAQIGDFNDPTAVEAVLRASPIDWVIHLVSTTVPSSSNDNMLYDIESNLVPTVRLLQLMRRHGNPRLIFLSSGGTVYGEVQSETPISEDHPTHPICSHGIVKLAVEQYIHLFARLHGLQYLILRVSNPFGEHHASESQGLINVILRRLARGEPITIWGDGRTVRDYIYVKDLARIVGTLIRLQVVNETINVGSGHGTAINDVLRIIKRIKGEFPVLYKPGRPCDVSRVVLDTAKLRSLIADDLTDLQTGIRNTACWLADEQP